jgi:hypothetical protein
MHVCMSRFKHFYLTFLGTQDTYKWVSLISISPSLEHKTLISESISFKSLLSSVSFRSRKHLGRRLSNRLHYTQWIDFIDENCTWCISSCKIKQIRERFLTHPFQAFRPIHGQDLHTVPYLTSRLQHRHSTKIIIKTRSQKFRQQNLS